MNPKMAAVAGGTLAVAVAAVVVLTRPATSPRPSGPTAVEHLPGELPPVRDEVTHYAPGSPPAVSEAFLRAWWRGRYEEARQLATGEIRRRCETNLANAETLTPDQRETMRQIQVMAEAAHFDLERAVVTELPADDAGLARRQVRGEVHAHGSLPDGRRIESRRGQVLQLELVEGAWRVSRWNWEAADGGIRVGGSP